MPQSAVTSRPAAEEGEESERPAKRARTDEHISCSGQSVTEGLDGIPAVFSLLRVRGIPEPYNRCMHIHMNFSRQNVTSTFCGSSYVAANPVQANFCSGTTTKRMQVDVSLYMLGTYQVHAQEQLLCIMLMCCLKQGLLSLNPQGCAGDAIEGPAEWRANQVAADQQLHDRHALVPVRCAGRAGC